MGGEPLDGAQRARRELALRGERAVDVGEDGFDAREIGLEDRRQRRDFRLGIVPQYTREVGDEHEELLDLGANGVDGHRRLAQLAQEARRSRASGRRAPAPWSSASP